MKRVLKGLDKIKLTQWRCQFCRRLMFHYGISPKQLGVEQKKCRRCGEINNILILDAKAYPINEKTRQKTLIEFRTIIQKLGLQTSDYSVILKLIK